MSPRPVVVAGGGVAGLVAAVELALAGTEVVLVEAQDRLGGCCCTLPRPGGAIEPAASVVLGLDMLRTVLEPLGVDVGPFLRRLTAAARVRWPDGTSLDLLDGPDFAESLAGRAPRDADNVVPFARHWTAVARRLFAALDGWPTPGALLLAPPLLRSYRSIVRDAFRDQRVRAALEAYGPFYAGLPAGRTPGIFALLPALAMSEGCHVMTGGIQRLPELLAARLQAAGGRIRTGETLLRLLTGRGRVTAVQTTKETLSVAGVVAALDLEVTQRALPAGARLGWRVRTMRRSVSCVSVLGTEPGTTDTPEVVWLPGRGEDPVGPGGLWPMVAVTRGPGGNHIRIGGAVTTPSQLRSPYARDQVAAHLLRAAERAGLGLHLTDAEVWTPDDYQSRLRLPHGAAFGFAAIRRQLGPGRYGPGTPYANLAVAGHSTFPGFGIPMAALSGRLAARTLSTALRGDRSCG